MKNILAFIFLLPVLVCRAQIPDHIYKSSIHTVKLYKYGDIYSFPVLQLNTSEQMELHFDDLDGSVKNYYYTFQLCDADWSPANLRSFDYIRGFQTNRINTYRYSSISYARYTHYQAYIPDRNTGPTRSGNYLLKVFLDDDTSKLVFTKRFLVVDAKASVSAQVYQPFNSRLSRTHQRVQVSVSTATAQSKLNNLSPQDLKVVIVQNNVWANGLQMDRPTIFRGNYYEYSDEEYTVFPSGREWRWLDLRSVRLLSDRMAKIIDTAKRIDILMNPDADRRTQIYVYYQDLDGLYAIENTDGNNPLWQSEYAYTHFTFIPPGNRALEGKSIYIFGELTNYSTDDESKMIFNDEKGVYEKTLLLKQGYYNYSYVTVNDRGQSRTVFSSENTEGNFWETENSYMVMVYYRPFGARADELVGFARLNSPFQR